jgi:hypothetical protein
MMVSKASKHDNDSTSPNSTHNQTRTKSERFCTTAENDGRARATQPNAARPIWNTRSTRYDDFAYTTFDFIHRTIGISVPQRDFVHAYVTAQMSAKKGLTVFGQQGADALMKELRQLVIMKVMNGTKSHELTKEQKRRALKYLMFLKEKRCGRIKGRGCADGRKQRLYKTKEETSSPTPISIEAVLFSCMIDAMEDCDVATLDIPGAFTRCMQAMIDEEVHIKFDGKLIDLLCQVNPSLSKFVGMENGKKVLCTSTPSSTRHCTEQSKHHYCFGNDCHLS